MTARQQHGITHRLIRGTIALGIWVLAAVPAGAEPNEVTAGPSPGSPAQKEEIDRGIREGLSALVPGLPPPPTQPRP